MLIRVTGARAGIADYLRHGLKEDREFSREQMDERVILAGDLDLTDSIIRGMTNEGDKYLHVTLAFREDNVSPETLQAVTDEFRAFAFSAYGADEFNFYAEAQLPRIKSYTDKATGERVVRKPHIHIVIPQKNLLTGTTFNPFKTADYSNEFLKAFQERVNAQYGLASPDDYKRESFNTNSEVVSRYKGGEFAGANKAIKEKIRDDVIARRIETPEAFRAYLEERWPVSTVNSKGRECLAIKPEGSARHVRLKDAFFSVENITRPTAEKIAAQKEPPPAYVTAKDARQVQEHYREREAYWHAIQAKENKHTNSGRKGEWRSYKALDEAGRAAFLAEKEAKFNTKHRQELAHDLTNADRSAIARHIDANVRAAGRHIDAAGRVDRNDELARRKLDDRRIARATRAIVHGRGGDQKEHGERRTVRRSDTPAGTHLAKLQDEQQQRSKSRGAMDEIKQRLDGDRLLKHLSHTHGVDPTKYQVHRTEQGDRIQCGGKFYNVTDFCTKEMHMPFAEAAPVLRECYAGQKKERGVEAKQRPREALWQDYTKRWRDEQRPVRAKAMDEHKARVRQEKRAVVDQCRRERAKLTATRGMRKVDKDAARSVLRVRQVEAEAALKVQHAAALKEVAEKYPARPTFNDYLQDQAQRGQVEALNELRRQAKPEHREPEAQSVAIEAKRANEAKAFEAALGYRVGRNGDVTYYDKAGDVMRDEAARVQAYRTDDATLATALRVAERKFYEPGQKGATTVDLAGSDEQIRRAIEVAAKENINVQFADPKHEAMRRELRQQIREREDLRNKGRAFVSEHRTERDSTRKNQADRPTPKPVNQRQRPAPDRDTSPKPDKGRGGPEMGG
ncbi:LPD7 domain-containing protein [Xanthomonas euvesicatoria]|uniref:LPD7 domain-containing protein n=1 Tax=Xanthomonas euvesicatoria TaxID=456327 RepID=UPI003B68599B